ncbi:unknown [Firmicutes bacterium CAG:449]|nr:unknown [Firmicutes bacterium CAG:449]
MPKDHWHASVFPLIVPPVISLIVPDKLYIPYAFACPDALST